MNTLYNRKVYSKDEGMHSDLIDNSASVIEHPIINGHEMLLFEADIAWNVIKGWVMTQYLDQKGLLVYDGKLINQTFLDAIVQSENDDFFQKPLKFYSMESILKLINLKKFEKIREIIRNQIWEAIEKERIVGISYIFNFHEHILTNKSAILDFERILKDLFQNKFGFPIDCCCLYPSSIDVLDFAELVNLHEGYQVFDQFQKPKLKHHPYTDQEVTQESDIDPSIILSDNSLPYVAKRALSKANSSFFFYQGGEIIGEANDLENFYTQLKNVSLDVFCFHCYRISHSTLAGKSISPSPRSDIALWIEYSIGDTQLAHQIYNTVSHSLGDRVKTLEAGSRFTQLTIKSAVLKLIKTRLDYFSNGEFM
ncbi:MAG: hypothetical protein ACFFAE_07905 [Candidatus Hodarchaeota archaeon]